MSTAAIDRELAYLQERAEAPRRPNLGCSNIAHDRLGFCGDCTFRDARINGLRLEAACWQLLALRDAATAPDAPGPYPSSAFPSDGA